MTELEFVHASPGGLTFNWATHWQATGYEAVDRMRSTATARLTPCRGSASVQPTGFRQ